MKRLLILVCLLLFATSFVYAEQIGVGVSVGANLAFLSTEGALDSLLSERSPRIGLSAGVYGDYEFHAIQDKLHLSVQPGIFYTMKGFRLDEVKINLDYLEIPVLVKARMPLDGSLSPYALLGPSIGLNVVRESESGSFSVSSDDKRTDFGIIFGAGVDLDRDISLDIRANFGLVNIMDTSSRNQNHSVALMVSYRVL